MVLGLAAMPLCALVAVVLLTFQKYHSDAVNTLAMNQGLVVLPFVLLTSIVLLFAVLILADHQRLERANQLSGLREIYYQGLRQQESQVRQLRHDLRNHLTVIQGLLEKSDPQGAIDYLEQIAGSPALQGRRRFCSLCGHCHRPPASLRLLRPAGGRQLPKQRILSAVEKTQNQKSPLIPPGTPMPPGLSKRAYLPKCFKQSWAIPTTPQRLIFTTILTQNPSFMRWILLRLLTSYYQIQKIKTIKNPCNH